MDRIDNANLHEALRDIANTNTYFHLDFDLNISIGQMEVAQKLDDPYEKTLIWIPYPSGIDCYSENQAFIKGTREYNGLQYHANDMQSDRKLAYVVEVTGINDGKVCGNIFEIDLFSYAKMVHQNALTSNEVRLYVDEPYGINQIVMPKVEFDNNYPKLPKMLCWRNIPTDTQILHSLLDKAYAYRESDCKLRELWAHVSDKHDSRFDFYANQTVNNINKLHKPNGRDEQSFSVSLNSTIASAFNVEQLSKLLDNLPYKNATLAIQKGLRDMRVVVPADEVMAQRSEIEKKVKPSILGQIQESKKALAQGNETKIPTKSKSEQEV